MFLLLLMFMSPLFSLVLMPLGVIWIRISDIQDLPGSWCIKGTNESTMVTVFRNFVKSFQIYCNKIQVCNNTESH